MLIEEQATGRHALDEDAFQTPIFAALSRGGRQRRQQERAAASVEEFRRDPLTAPIPIQSLHADRRPAAAALEHLGVRTRTRLGWRSRTGAASRARPAAALREPAGDDYPAAGLRPVSDTAHDHVATARAHVGDRPIAAVRALPGVRELYGDAQARGSAGGGPRSWSNTAISELPWSATGPRAGSAPAERQARDVRHQLVAHPAAEQADAWAGLSALAGPGAFVDQDALAGPGRHRLAAAHC